MARESRLTPVTGTSTAPGRIAESSVPRVPEGRNTAGEVVMAGYFNFFCFGPIGRCGTLPVDCGTP